MGYAEKLFAKKLKNLFSADPILVVSAIFVVTNLSNQLAPRGSEVYHINTFRCLVNIRDFLISMLCAPQDLTLHF